MHVFFNVTQKEMLDRITDFSLRHFHCVGKSNLSKRLFNILLKPILCLTKEVVRV